MLPSADYIVPVEIESQTHNVYVIKRPGVDHFLKEMGKYYEVVIFTASLSKVRCPNRCRSAEPNCLDSRNGVGMLMRQSVCGSRFGHARYD